MGILSSLFGGSRTSSSQTQTQDSFGYSVNRAVSEALSGGSSSGFSSGVSGSQGASRSTSGVFAGDVLQQLYQGAFGAAGAIDPRLATERVNQLFTGGSNIIQALSGGGAGEDYLTRRLSGDNSEVLNAQIDALGSDLGRFYSEELNPTITGNAVAAGQLGGGRQGVAQGVATSNILREFATQAAGLRAADVAQRDSAALGLLGAKNANAQTALAGIEGLSGLATGTEALAPYAALSQIIGGPTVLTQSESTQSSFGQEYSEQQAQEFATSLAEELGISYDEAHALLTATSKGKSSGGIIPGISNLVGSFTGKG